jgi:hypothetical protein
MRLIESIGEGLADVAADLEDLKKELKQNPHFDSSATDAEWEETEGDL